MGQARRRSKEQKRFAAFMSERFSNFTDLGDHSAREIATPDYVAAVMEQTELAKLSVADKPTSAEMPDRQVAQAATEMMLATVFDLFRDTRMDDREVSALNICGGSGHEDALRQLSPLGWDHINFTDITGTATSLAAS